MALGLSFPLALPSTASAAPSRWQRAMRRLMEARLREAESLMRRDAPFLATPRD